MVLTSPGHLFPTELIIVIIIIISPNIPHRPIHRPSLGNLEKPFNTPTGRVTWKEDRGTMVSPADVRSVLYGWKPIIRAADPEGNDNCGRRIILSTTSLAAAVRNSAGLIMKI